MTAVDLVIQVSDDTGVRYERCRLPQDGTLSVGRAWHSDVLVRDLQADPDHLVLARTETGELTASDQQTLNGTRLAGRRLNGVEEIPTGAVLRIGKSSVVIHRADQPVGPAVRPSRWESVREFVERPAWAVVISLVLVVCQLLQMHAETVNKLTLGDLIVGVAGVLTAAAIWALLWGLLTRLLRNAMHLRAHYAIAATVAVGSFLLEFFSSWVGWQTLNVHTMELVDSIGSALLIFVLAALTLGVATTLRRPRLLGIAAIAPVLLLTSTWVLPLLQDEPQQWWPEIVSVSRPPTWTLAEGQAMDEFLGSGATLFDAVSAKAQERAAELAAGADSGSGD